MALVKPTVKSTPLNGVNTWLGKRQPPRAIVLHIAEGSAQGCISWFRTPSAQASSNYLVDIDGTIYQFIDPEGPDAPFANGLVDHPDAAVQALIRQTGGINPNYWTVSIEHAGHSGIPLTSLQLQASARLTAWLMDHFAIPNDEDHLLGHYEFDSVTRAGCPGFDRQAWVSYEAAVDDALHGSLPSLEERVVAAVRAAFAARASATGLSALPDAFHHGAPGPEAPRHD